MRRKSIGLILGILTAAAVTVSLSGCASSTALKDGYYTAQASDYWGSGWKEFVMITVKGGRIIAVEYNAEDANGFAKSWDTEYLQNMMDCQGTYPNEYMRAYINQLLEEQSANQVDAISGATTSARYFEYLTQAAIEQARKGDSQTVIVEVPNS